MERSGKISSPQELDINQFSFKAATNHGKIGQQRGLEALHPAGRFVRMSTNHGKNGQDRDAHKYGKNGVVETTTGHYGKIGLISRENP